MIAEGLKLLSPHLSSPCPLPSFLYAIDVYVYATCIHYRHKCTLLLMYTTDLVFS